MAFRLLPLASLVTVGIMAQGLSARFAEAQQVRPLPPPAVALEPGQAAKRTPAADRSTATSRVPMGAYRPTNAAVSARASAASGKAVAGTVGGPVAKTNAAPVGGPRMKAAGVAGVGAAASGAAAVTAPAQMAPLAKPVSTAPPIPTGFIDPAAEGVGLSVLRLNRIGEVLRHEAKTGQVPGAVVMIARRGRVIYQQAFGQRDAATKAPMRPDALFRIYDMGLPVVTAAALMLVEDGVIQLADPVARHVPALKDWKVADERGETAPMRPVSVHDLMRLTAGLAFAETAGSARAKTALASAGLSNGLKAAIEGRAQTPAEHAGRLAKAMLAAQPGAAWEAGPAADVLGHVVAAAAGKPLGQFLKERVFEPLGMSDAAFVVGETKRARLAEAGPGAGLVDVGEAPGAELAGSGLVLSATDALRFGQMLLNGGVLDGKRVLSPSTVRLMTANHLNEGVRFPAGEPGQHLVGSAGYGFGLGVAVRKSDGVAGVPGAAGSYLWGGVTGSTFWVDPKEELVIVYQAQSPTADRERARRLVMQLVYQAIVK